MTFKPSVQRKTLLAHIERKIELNQPLLIRELAQVIQTTEERAKRLIYGLAAAGILQYEHRGGQLSKRYRVTLPDGRSTPWPEDGERADAKPRGDEIEALRRQAEAERQQHVRTWLAKERAPRRREREKPFFIDKATVLALQGISA